VELATDNSSQSNKNYVSLDTTISLDIYLKANKLYNKINTRGLKESSDKINDGIKNIS